MLKTMSAHQYFWPLSNPMNSFQLSSFRYVYPLSNRETLPSIVSNVLPHLPNFHVQPTPSLAACLSPAWVGFGCWHSAPGCLPAEWPFSPYCNLGHPGKIVSVRGRPPPLPQLWHPGNPPHPSWALNASPRLPSPSPVPLLDLRHPARGHPLPAMEPNHLCPLTTCAFKIVRGGKGRQQRRRAFFLWVCGFFLPDYFLSVLNTYLCLLDLSCGIWDLVPRPGIDPRPPALGTWRAWSLSHWMAREVPFPVYFSNTWWFGNIGETKKKIFKISIKSSIQRKLLLSFTL